MNKFIFIGDSLTFGYGVPKTSSWVSLFKVQTSYDVINKGINGDTTPSMLDRFYSDILSLNPSKVFIMGGTNDLLNHRSVKSIKDNLELMIKDCISKNISVTLAAPPSIIPEMAQNLFMPSPFYNYCKEQLSLLRNECKNLCDYYNISFVDFYTPTLYSTENIFSDGIHFNLNGQNLLYKIFLDNFNITNTP
ncbi:MAG: GDSL-type esterase/lipase family protein [Clostridium sp.]